MNVTRKQERLLRRALTEWQQEGALTPDEHQRLASSLKASPWTGSASVATPSGRPLPASSSLSVACLLTAN